MIIVDEGSEVSYIEGCTAPIYQSYSLHTGLVEIIVKKGAKIKFTTVQNWSKNIYNFSFKKAEVDSEGQIEWVMASLGAKVTMSYPTTILKGESAKTSYLDLTIASDNQIQSTGAKVIHQAEKTSCNILAKSISKKGGKTIFRGLIKTSAQVSDIKSYMRCHSLILDKNSKSYSYPALEIGDNKSKVGHEATFGGLSDEQLFYLKSRGLDNDKATALIINGFISPITKDLPMDYAVELKRLIEISL
ncbi:MAG: ABC-type transport system involved in Fe-S cluster assembly [uncultured bacterium]|nr:MAG: ABC-type transport system involved in Fe-S cluster assembly [uncultured bacterium]